LVLNKHINKKLLKPVQLFTIYLLTNINWRDFQSNW